MSDRWRFAYTDNKFHWLPESGTASCGIAPVGETQPEPPERLRCPICKEARDAAQAEPR